MTIRELQPGEWDQLRELIVAASAELEKVGQPNMTAAVTYAVHSALSASQPIFVAEEGGKLIGFVAWCLVPGTPAGMLTGGGRYVDPAHRRKGVDKAMQDAAKAYWREDARAVYVRGEVALGNEAGREAARAAGWEVVGHAIELVL